MLTTREQQEQIERESLAPYAQHCSESRGRVHREPQHDLRTAYARDRDRVIHSRAFRRLEYKTQVFLNGTGDHYRTRLTHSIEVAAIARSIARALRLNEDLAETIALAHDLGHSPFGHSGERTLNEMMAGHGGFEHNVQSLRVVDELEKKYPAFDGLNLTYETREGLAKHVTSYDQPSQTAGFEIKHPSLEAQVANIADEITYYSHDLDDGLDAKLLTEKGLLHITLWQEINERVARQHPRLDPTCRYYYAIRCLINAQVQDVIANSNKLIEKSGVRSADDVRRCGEALIRYSPAMQKRALLLRDYLYQNLYYNPAVARINRRACELMKEFFEALMKKPRLIGSQSRARIAKIGVHRAVCDYISGMTDRYLIAEHNRVFGLKDDDLPLFKLRPPQ
ncbi:MAG: deoxyguanosinetriphosphate triphosphohydrolase [Verrucomicrobia bacterium]|nr:deoxyguanosinetriphosphate triphosphohydrolase [Verrucomicrobiota bacterium]